MKKKYLGIAIMLSLLLITGCTKSIVGKWKSDSKDSDYYFIFNNDKSCSYEMKFARLDCTYEKDDNTITIFYNGEEEAKTYGYRFEKNKLIITDENGNDNIFIKK